jgi:REP element-mobilizing transposase RayT
VNGEMLFDNDAKETLRKQLHQAAEFSGVEVITYALMSNHFHVLVKVPEQKDISDAELLRRYKVLHPMPTPWASEQIEVLEELLKNNTPDAEKFRQRLLARMGNVSEFMKTVKQRFSIWFNKHHGRFGTLWAERFASTIVEGNHHYALKMVAAYIDLNPVRAGIVRDPKDYRWCGYGEAEAIGGKMVGGLRNVIADGGQLADSKVLAEYRIKLFGKGSAPKRGDSSSPRLSEKELQGVVDAGGQLSDAERLRLKMRWFARGAVIGGQQFVSEHLQAYQTRTKKRRTSVPQPFPSMSNNGADSDSGELFAMRGGRES